MVTKRNRPLVRVGFGQWTAAFMVPRFLYPGSLFQANLFTLFTLLPAFALTWGLYALFNYHSSDKVRLTFATAQLDELKTVDGSSKAAALVVEKGWADEKLYSWLRDVLKPSSGAFPASQQVVVFFTVPGGGPREGERLDLLRESTLGTHETQLPAFVGEVPSWVTYGFPLKIKSPDPVEIYYAQEGFGDSYWRKAGESTNAGEVEEKKKFILRYLEPFVNTVNGPVRAMRRLNGWVQWLTIMLTFTLLIAAVRRWFLVASLSVSAARAAKELEQYGSIDPDDVFPRSSEIATIVGQLPEGLDGGDADDKAPQHAERLRDTAGNGVYGVFTNVAAAIPGIGFLGTVLGMGNALLRADGLFSSQDKQRVIGLITQDLGFAFDTTLVALVCSPVVLLVMALVRLSEHKMFLKWAEVLQGARAPLVAKE